MSSINFYESRLNIMKDLGFFSSSTNSPLDMILFDSMISCWGVSVDPDTMKYIMNIAFGGEKAEKRTGNVGLNSIVIFPENTEMIPTNKCLPCETIYTTPNKAFTSGSPITLTRYMDEFKLGINGSKIANVEIIKAPEWYTEEIEFWDGKIPRSTLFQYESPFDLMGTVPLVGQKKAYQECEYFKRQQQCIFCGIQNKRSKPRDPQIYAETVRLQNKTRGDTAVTLTAGNTYESDRGIINYVPYVKAIKKQNPYTPIQIEASPPSLEIQDKILLELGKNGVTSIMSNLEVFPVEENNMNRLRSTVCPAKAQIPLNEYINFLRFAQQRGMTTYSVLISGLQPPKTIIEGTKLLTKYGITTVPLPAKPNQGSIIDSYGRPPEDPLTYMFSIYFMLKEMRNAGINPVKRIKKQYDCCASCGGCSSEKTFDENWKILMKNEDFFKTTGREYLNTVDKKWDEIGIKALMSGVYI